MRLFVAFEVPAETRRALDACTRRLRRRLPAARWVQPQAIHLTLFFLGETDPDLLPALGGELRSVFAGGEPMTLRLGDFGAFPPRGRRRVLWVGVEADGDLAALQGRVAAATERALALDPEAAERRPYRPHLTLARCKPPWRAAAVEPFIAASASLEAAPFTIDHGSLIASELHPSGARYRTIETYPLAGAR